MMVTARPNRVRTDEGIEAGKPTWGICGGCERDRRVNRHDLMIEHNRWNGREMVLCTGSLSPATHFTGWKKRRISA